MKRFVVLVNSYYIAERNHCTSMGSMQWTVPRVKELCTQPCMLRRIIKYRKLSPTTAKLRNFDSAYNVASTKVEHRHKN